MFLEDGDWNSANEYCEKGLDLDPKNARAYLGKLMARLRVREQADLKHVANPFDQDGNYQKAVRFAEEALKAELAGYVDHINTRNENARLEDIYTRAKQAMKAAYSEAAYGDAAKQFESIRHYQDSEALARECREKEPDAKKDSILANGYARMSRKTVEEYEQAIRTFSTIPGWRDADQQIELCKKKIEELKAKAEADRLERERKAELERQEEERIAKRNKKILKIAAPVIVAVAMFLVILNGVIIPNGKYNDAVALMEAGNYIEAKAAFEALEGYKDSADQIPEFKYREAVALMEAGENAKAAIAFGQIADYRGARAQSFALWDRITAYETVSAGSAHIVGLKSDGTVVAVGSNDYGQCDVSDWTDIVAVSAGGVHTVGLKSDGTVVAVGRNGDGQCDVSDWSEIVAISAGLGYTVGLRSDGTVVAAGSNDYGECDVSDWNNIRVRNVKN